METLPCLKFKDMKIEFKGDEQKIKSFLKEFNLRLKKDKITFSEIKKVEKPKNKSNKK